MNTVLEIFNKDLIFKKIVYTMFYLSSYEQYLYSIQIKAIFKLAKLKYANWAKNIISFSHRAFDHFTQFMPVMCELLV